MNIYTLKQLYYKNKTKNILHTHHEYIHYKTTYTP